jgi:hypothetical protein
VLYGVDKINEAKNVLEPNIAGGKIYYFYVPFRDFSTRPTIVFKGTVTQD